MSLLLLALLLFLLFGGSRVNAAGKGLGEAVRHVKKAVTEDAPPISEPEPEPSPMIALPETKEPKLLPAKGESSASAELGEAAPAALGAAKDDNV